MASSSFASGEGSLVSVGPVSPVTTEVRGKRARALGASVGAAGLLSVIAGTFLPWLISGGVARDSYAIAGIVGRLGLVGNGFGATALSWWPMLGPIAMLAMVAGIVRWWRTAGAVSLLFGALTGIVGGGVLAVADGHGAAGISVDRTGPMITLIGAGLTIVGAVLILVGSRRRHIPVPRHIQVLPVSAEPMDSPLRHSDHDAYEGDTRLEAVRPDADARTSTNRSESVKGNPTR